MADCPAYPAGLQEAEARGFREGIEAAAEVLMGGAMAAKFLEKRISGEELAERYKSFATAIRALEPK